MLMGKLTTYAVFILLALLTGTAMGMLFMPGEWYAALAKPAFNPPSWLFGPVWTVLYIMIGIAGAMAWRWDPQSGAMKAWFAQYLFNTAWSPVFFGLHWMGVAIVIILGMWLSIVFFMGRTWREVRVASLLFFPYFLWVSFASLLNIALWNLN